MNAILKTLVPRFYYLLYCAKKIARKKRVNQFEKTEVIKKSFCEIEEICDFKDFLTFDETIDLKFPNLLGVCKNQSIKLETSPRAFYKLSDVEIFIGNDFIVKNTSVFWDKKYRMIAFTHVIPMDLNLIQYNSNEMIFLDTETKFEFQLVQNAFFLCGVHSNIWSHFLVDRLPLLEFLKQRIIPKINERISIVMPDNVDPHIKELVEEYIGNLADFLYLKPKSKVKCVNLWYVDRGSWLSDHANEINIFDIIIDKQAKNFLKQYNGKGSGAKLFLGRNGNRNLTNYHEVLDYFRSQGYVEVFPHTLTLKEKRELFGNASHLVGPASSAFTNAIFCPTATFYMSFINFSRAMDPYIPSIIQNSDNYFALSGHEIIPGNINSDYYINLKEIIHYSTQLGFTS